MGCRACGIAGRRLPVSGDGGDVAGGGGGVGAGPAASALAPSGQPIWLEIARGCGAGDRRPAGGEARRYATSSPPTRCTTRWSCTRRVGGSTNLLLHIPAIAFEAGLTRPTVDDWNRINRQVPRIVDVLPNGPIGHPTVRLFLAGGVPEVMLHLRTLGLLKLDALTATGRQLGDVLEWWERSERRMRFRELLTATGRRRSRRRDHVARTQAKSRGLTSTVTFPTGNIAPEGSVIKSTAIDPSVVDADGVYRKTGPARSVHVGTGRRSRRLKGAARRPIKAGDIIVLMCRGPLGAGMEETYQITSALRYLPFGKQVAVITDARFSGVSTGACIGHVGPEALAGGPIGKLRDGDMIEIVVDRVHLTGSINLIGSVERPLTAAEATAELAARTPSVPLQPDPDLPADTRLWALLQQLGGGTWGGCVYDVNRLAEALSKKS